MKKKVKLLGYTPKTHKFLQELYSEHEISDSAGVKLLELIGDSLDRIAEAEDLLKKEGRKNGKNGDLFYVLMYGAKID